MSTAFANTSPRRATAIGLLAVLCWSCTVGLMRSVTEALGAVGGAATLYTVSALLVLLVQGLPRPAQLRQASRMYLLVCGALFVAYEICLSVSIGWAQDRTQALEMGLINYLWPSLTIVLAVLTRQQSARWWLWPGVLLCLAGLVRVMVGDAGAEPAAAGAWWSPLATHIRSNPAAYALAFMAALLWPAYSVLARRFGGGFNAVGVFMAGTATVLWLHWLGAGEPPMRWSWGMALQVLAVGGLTAAGYSCWELGIQRGNLAVVAAGSYFTPVLSAGLASAWLAVQPGWSFWQGVVMVTAGSLVCWSATRVRVHERADNRPGTAS